MMIRGLTVSLLFAVFATPAYAQDAEQVPTADPTTDPVAQDNPLTRETDVDEDDYRRSQRRRDTGNIFDDIDINPRSDGSGGILGPNVKAIDRLDQESRRHLNKQRAKALAEAGPGERIDADYEPSDEAKIDDYVAKQEEQAWDEMIREANNGTGIIQGPKGGHAFQGGASQGDSEDGNSAEGGGEQSETQNERSILSGKSAESASAILDQIKGRSNAGNSQQGQAEQGQSQQGQGESDGQSENDGGSEGEAKTESEQTGQTGQDASEQGEASAEAQAESDAEAQSDSDSNSDAQAAADAAADASEAASAAAKSARTPEELSPLERIKRDALEQDDTGGRTSASDYLKRVK